MNIREIVAIRDRLRGELETVEKFLEIARRMEPDAQPAPVLPQDGKPPAGQQEMEEIVSDGKYGGIGDAVMEAIKISPPKFSINDIETSLRKLNSSPLTKGQMATALSRFNHRGFLRIVEERRGRIPAKYQLIINQPEGDTKPPK